MEGKAVEPQAYAAFLRGAMAEADGDPKAAIAAYEEASGLDPKSPEIWTRIGEVSCRAAPRDPRADEAFAHAFEENPMFSRLPAARSRCQVARGEIAAGRALAAEASARDPTADGANVLWATTAIRAEAATNDGTRAVLIGLTLTARDPLVAWGALASWAESRGDAPSWARALRELVRISPARRDDAARAAEELVGAGHPREARTVAAAAADADAGPLRGGHEVAARLAVDEAIERSDGERVRGRATRVRLALDEAAARALLAGERTLARAIALEVAAADPSAGGARLVLAALGTDPLSFAMEARPNGEVPPSGAAFVAFGVALLDATTVARAGAALRSTAHEPILQGDDRVVRAAVELVARGALAIEDLPPDGAVELAASRGDALPEGLLRAGGSPLDTRHEYLALALAHPDSLRARMLGARLDADGSPDAIVAAASALMQLASGAPSAAAAARSLLARNPGDPLLAATALRVAEKAGDKEVARRARDALTALRGPERRSVQ